MSKLPLSKQSKPKEVKDRSPVNLKGLLNIRSPTDTDKNPRDERLDLKKLSKKEELLKNPIKKDEKINIIKKDERKDERNIERQDKIIDKEREYERREDNDERERRRDRRDDKGDDRERRRDKGDRERRRDKEGDDDRERRRDKEGDDDRERRRDRNKEEERRDKEGDDDRERRRDKDDDRERRRDRDKEEERPYKRERDERNENPELFIFTKLKDLLIENKNRIVRLYAEDGNYKFIEIISLLDGEKMLIYIPSKYPIPISLEYPYIEIITIDPNEDFDNDLNKLNPSSAELDDYKNVLLLSKNKHINITDDELLNQLNDFKEIDLEKDYLTKIKESITIFHSQLERFQKTTNKIKYKFGILTSRVLSIINRHNEIDHYLFKQPIKSISKELIIVLDLESYYNKLEVKDDINIDIRKIYMNIFSSFNNIHSKENIETESKLKYCLDIMEKIPTHYDQQQTYLTMLNELTSKFVRYNEEEKILQDRLLKVRYSDETDVSRSLQINKLELEIEKLNKIRDEAITLYRDMKNKYTEIMLNYDHVLFDNILLLHKIKKNFKVLKI
jgi:hypothetical protein